MKPFKCLILSVLVVGCGRDYTDKRTESDVDSKAITWIVQANAVLHLQVDAVLGLTAWTGTGNDDTDIVNVTMSPNVNMTMSTASFTVPTLTNSVLGFGSLDLTSITDNNLKVCGVGSNQKCTAAAIRVYTTAEPGAGFWNTVDAYGAPLSAAVGTATYQTTGVGVANAAYVDTIVIGANTHTVTQASFSPAPNVLIQGDFTNAGAASYSATINVEYVVGM